MMRSLPSSGGMVTPSIAAEANWAARQKPMAVAKLFGDVVVKIFIALLDDVAFMLASISPPGNNKLIHESTIPPSPLLPAAARARTAQRRISIGIRSRRPAPFSPLE